MIQIDGCRTIFPSIRLLDRAAELVGHELHAVADAQDGNLKSKNREIGERSLRDHEHWQGFRRG